MGRPKFLYDNKRDPRVLAFLEDILKVCRKHALQLEHEDHHGAFLVTFVTDSDGELDASYVGWLRAAAQVEAADDE